LLIGAGSAEDLPLWTSRQLLEPVKRLESTKRWLENCRQNHEQCKALEASLNTSCPTRLIDVSQQVPRLVCPHTNTKTSYAALSHCWGGSTPIKSTQKTLGKHMVAVQITAMPKKYRDAITITRELGIQYLWIDSLCIIQDDAKDWEQEAARMASIYEGAQVTIAAAWGKNGESGCFHDYHPSMVVEVQEQNNFKGYTEGSTVRLYLRPCSNPWRYLGHASLNSRAWTLQEVILSRRTIIFAEDQLYWHCTSLYESEDGLEFVDNMAEGAFSLPSLGPIVRQPVTPSYKLYEGWQTTMEDYSARSLTRPDDKYAALAGVTQMFQRVVKDEPLAGLWKNDVCGGLLWQVPPGMHGKLDSEAVRALNIPSWSWVKVHGLVQMKVSGIKPCVEISSASVSWSGLPLTSKINNASITGRGKLIRILDIQRDEDEACMCLGVKRLCIESPSDEPSRYHRAYLYIDECTSEIKDTLSCLLIWISEIRDRRKSDPYVTSISALIVTAVQSSHSKSTYRRVGVGDFGEFPRDIYDNSLEVNFTLI
jgi:Heterokaryon incompatibility protein (HET)